MPWLGREIDMTRVEILTHAGKDGRVWRTLRFMVDGKRYREPLGVVSAEEAEQYRQMKLMKLRLGEAVVPAAKAPRGQAGDTEAPLFADYAREWLERKTPNWSERRSAGISWRLGHLLPFFGEVPI